MVSTVRLAFAGFLLAPAAHAQAATLFGGHQYEFVASNVNWQTALANAAAATPIAGYKAHLVTITSQAEDDFVKTLSGATLDVWAAGTDADVEGTWKWAAGPETGQTFFVQGGPAAGFANWNSFEPNNIGNEDHLQLRSFGPNWNDVPGNFSGALTGGYVIEFSPDETKTSFNGNQYQFVAGTLSWHEALAAAAAATPIEGFTAHLVTVTSQAEDDFVKTLFGTTVDVWGAGTDQALEGTWKWAAGPEAGDTFFVLGGPLTGFSNWNAFEPNDQGGEDYLQFNSFGPNWNDLPAKFLSGGYVIEFSRNGAVPEPATWAMMIIGFGLVGGMARRSRSQNAIIFS